MFDLAPELPQTVGDIIGRAISAWRNNVLLIFRVLLVPTLFATAGALGLQWLFTYGLKWIDVFGGFTSAHGASYFVLRLCLILVFGLVSLFVLLISGWILAIRQLALVRIIAGCAQNYSEAENFVNKRKWQILGSYILAIVLVIGILGFWFTEIVLAALLSRASFMLAVSVVGFLLGIVGLLFSFSLAIIIGCLALCILACEEISIFGAIAKAIRLTAKSFWRTIAFGFLLFVVISTIYNPLSLPMIILVFADMYGHGMISGASISASYEMPFYLMVINQSWESLMNMLIRPILFMAFGLFYYDFRLRNEGLDLRRKLLQLETS